MPGKPLRLTSWIPRWQFRANPPKIVRSPEEVPMTPEAIAHYIHHSMPDARVAVTYRTGTDDHISIHVLSEAFASLNRLDRQRLVYQALSEPMADRRIKACAVKTGLPEDGPLQPGPAQACISKTRP